MTRDTKYLEIYTDMELIEVRNDAQKAITDGSMIGRVDPYLDIIKDINSVLVIRLAEN